MATPTLQLRPRIVPTGQKLSWFDARKAVEAKGGLPDHSLLGRHLCDPDYQASLTSTRHEVVDSVFPLWPRNLYAYPVRGQRFRSDQPIHDHVTGLFLSWSELVKYVARSTIIRSKTSLYITPRDVQPERVTIDGRETEAQIVYPASIVPVHPAVGVDEQWGKVHEPTGMVLEVREEELRELSRSDSRHKKRRLFKSIRQGLGQPIHLAGSHTDRRYVNAIYKHVTFGVAYVVYDMLGEKNQILAEGVTLADMRKFAQGKTVRALGVLRGEQLDAARRLALANIQ